MAYITLRGVKLYYEDTGQGRETLFFGHSMLFNLRMFDRQVDHFKDRYRCIRFDFRGHGNSESPVDGYDLDTLAEDAVELLRELKGTPCHFVGFSMGGMVALRAALKYPELIKSLILIDTSSEPEPSEGMLRNKAMIFTAKYIGLRPLASKVMTMFFGRDFLVDPSRRVLRKTWKNHFRANDRVGIVKAVKGVLFRDGITDQISAITQPTTILVGENDQLTDLEKAKIIHDKIKHARLVVVPRAGHMSPVEEPDMVTSTMADHLIKVGQ